MERIRFFARMSVRRGCGFALLGIITVLIGLSPHPALALRATATLLTLMVAVLLILVARAPRTHYHRRELWMLLDHWHGLPERHAQSLITLAMQETFLAYADRTALAALVVWVVRFAV